MIGKRNYVQVALAVALVLVCSFVVGASAPITIYPALLELPVGAGVFVQVIELADRAGNMEQGDLVWVSEGPGVATVSPRGYITALAVGETRVEVYLTSNPSLRASCRIVVLEAGPILLYPMDNPPEPPLDPPAESPGDSDGDGGIPVEHDPELDTPVIHDPRIDEFFWTIRINDTISQKLEGDLPLKMVYKLDLEVVKEGGKTAKGVYTGTATLEFKLDTGEYEKQIMGMAEGILLKFMVHIGGTYQGSLDLNVEAYDMERFARFNLAPGEAPVVPLVKIYNMALGEMQLSGTGQAGASSLDASGVGIDLFKPPMSSNAPLGYRLALQDNGQVRMTLELGVADSFRGQITRKPFIPD